MEEFYTRSAANEGRTLPLYLPNGTKSEHSFVVRGVDSDEFRTTENKVKRRAIDIAQMETEEERLEAINDSERECIASLIISWTFDMECTTENKVSFLREAPQIADAINRFSAKRTEFLSKKSGSSAAGSEAKET